MCLQIPEEIVSVEGEDITKRLFSPQLITNEIPVSETITSGKTFDSRSIGVVKLCGILPIKEIEVKTVSGGEVIPCGNIVGIKLFTEGVLVISTDSFSADGKSYSPALKSGIKSGDLIVAANGKKINSAKELEKAISENNSNISLTVFQDGKEKEIKIKPEFDEKSRSYKLGAWVRDSCAGIGTLTFFRPDSLKYGALGHGLTDNDTGEIYSVSGGMLTRASVLSVEKGKRGVPGELCGIMTGNEILGTLESNSVSGITGTLEKTDFSHSELCTLASRTDIVCGKATILSCVGGTNVDSYEIEIQRVCSSGENSSKDILIRVTDPDLLEKTGGIVQGMSGSPILQNGKLIGAVTHVFVNDPTRGYGIFIDKMLK